MAAGEGITVAKKETSSSMKEETHQKKSRKIAIQETAEEMVLKKTVLQRWNNAFVVVVKEL